MIEFRTSIEKIKPEFSISCSSKILTLGSCFSDVLGNYLSSHKLDCLANPFGNVYNLKSIYEIISELSNNSKTEKDAIVENDGVFFHYNYHSEIRDFSKEKLIQKIEFLNQETLKFLRTCDFLTITLGTSWVYEKNNDHTIVSNCHKQNSALFNKKILSESKQLDIFRNIYFLLKKINPELKIILTVSPVRHLKDTLQLNSVSKSILRALCYQITTTHADVFYFPAYEIMMDDLRDYRFYKSDLIHPNEQAEKYILETFNESYFDADLKEFILDWKKIKAAMEHRPFNPQSDKHQKFLKNLLQKIQAFENQIDAQEEIKIIKSQIS